MHWTNWSEFWAMGGYGLYVWGSFGMTALALALESWSLRSRYRALRRDVAVSILDTESS